MLTTDTPTTALRIEYSVSREQYIAGLRDATQLLVRQVRWGAAMHWLTVASVVCGVAIGMGYMELVNGYIGRNLRLQWLMVVAFLAVCLLTLWQQRLRATRIYASCAAGAHLLLGPQVLWLTADGLSHESPRAGARVAWAVVKQVLVDDSRVLIVLSNYSFWIVPAAAFADAAQREQWVAALRTYLPQAVTTSPASAHDRVAQESPPAPDASAPASGFGDNLRAGARLAFFRPVPFDRLVATPEAFTVLVLFDLLLLLAQGMLTTGWAGQLNYDALPRALWTVPLVLLFGVAAARAAENRLTILALPVVLLAAGCIVSVAGILVGMVLQPLFTAAAERFWHWFFYAQVAWWSAIIVTATWRYAPAARSRIVGLAALGIALLSVLPVWMRQEPLWIPKYDAAAQRAEFEKSQALADEKGFYAQHGALSRALSALRPQRPGVVDVYALTAGLYADEDVFMKEVRFIDKLLRQRFDAEGRALVLVNNPQTVHEFAVASITSVSAALRHIGELMDTEEDVLLLYVSSHGSQNHQLTVNFRPLRLRPIDPPALKRALDDSKIKWKVLVVSACYSGGFVAPLKDDNTLIITASSASKTSFGCGNTSEATYLAKALFDEELRKTYSFETAFGLARQSILRREQAQGYEPSEPQIFIGAAIRDKLLQMEKRLSELEN